MTGRIADAEKDRFLPAARLFEGALVPRQPIHRIVSVLEKVRRFFVHQQIGVLESRGAGGGVAGHEIGFVDNIAGYSRSGKRNLKCTAGGGRVMQRRPEEKQLPQNARQCPSQPTICRENSNTFDRKINI